MSTLTINEATNIGMLLTAVQDKTICTWQNDMGDLLTGTLRAICKDEGGNFLHADEEVRDAVVWITTRMGLEVFLPVKDVLGKMHCGLFAPDFDGSI